MRRWSLSTGVYHVSLSRRAVLFAPYQTMLTRTELYEALDVWYTLYPDTTTLPLALSAGTTYPWSTVRRGYNPAWTYYRLAMRTPLAELIGSDPWHRVWPPSELELLSLAAPPDDASDNSGS
jgi:hypothetical protein